jgi:hypothetical protein
MTIAVSGTAGTTSTISSGYLRSHANSFFDRMYITSQNGNIIEDIQNYDLVNDTLVNLQMNNSVRDGIATQYGFVANSTDIVSQGHSIGIFEDRQLATGDKETHSYSVPLLSGCIGCLADKMLNIGRTSKLSLTMTTTSVLPISIITNSVTNASNFVVTLSDFSLQCEYIDIGLNALKMLDSTLVDGKSYIHGVSYKSSTNTLPAAITGAVSLLAGIRASSVKSLFVRFVESGVSVTTSVNGKFDSKNPMINSIQANIGGQKIPANPINPLLNPAQVFKELQLAIGSFNSSQFQSCIPPAQYCKLSTGGTASGLRTDTQDYNWNTGSSTDKQCLFIYGQNIEVCARRGLLSGLNCTSAPVFIDMNIASAPTNAHTMYVISMLDQILIHDVVSGDISVRI